MGPPSDVPDPRNANHQPPQASSWNLSRWAGGSVHPSSTPILQSLARLFPPPSPSLDGAFVDRDGDMTMLVGEGTWNLGKQGEEFRPAVENKSTRITKLG
jgi:hypothetical protein